jgi:hypothetical protein
MKRFFLLALLTISAQALAEQPQPSALEQALGQRVMAEVNANIQASATIVDLQRQLATAQERLKALEDKQPKTSEK